VYTLRKKKWKNPKRPDPPQLVSAGAVGDIQVALEAKLAEFNPTSFPLGQEL
jgi:hypothetical protein